MNAACAKEHISRTVQLLSTTKHEWALVSESKAKKGWALSPWCSELVLSYSHGRDGGYTLYYGVNERTAN
jgi:hypothetical protein